MPPPSIELTSGFALQVRVLLSAQTEIGEGWDGLPLQSEFWRLYWNFQPGALLEAKAENFVLEPEQLFLVPPRFAGVARVQGRIDHLYAHFDVLGLPHGLVPAVFPNPLRVPATPQSQALVAAWIAELQKESTVWSLPGALRVEALAAEALAGCWELVGASHSPGWKAWQARSPRLAQLETWMTTRLDQDLSVARLAEWTGYSTDHFRRVFAKIFGMNPAAYVTQVRIKEVARLLMFSQSSIEEIAEATGFVDRHHLSRIFRRCTGETPAAYRQRRLAFA